jgi:hypothetical protein
VYRAVEMGYLLVQSYSMYSRCIVICKRGTAQYDYHLLAWFPIASVVELISESRHVPTCLWVGGATHVQGVKPVGRAQPMPFRSMS